MENKLDYLAAKEEELRKLNEQLDKKKDFIMKQPIRTEEESFAEESKYSVGIADDDEEEDDMAAFKGVQLNANQSEDGGDYEDENFDDSREGAKLAASQNLNNAIDWQKKYKALEAEYHEQTKTVNFQKAKIAALQTELEETLQQMAQKEIELHSIEKDSQKASN